MQQKQGTMSSREYLGIYHSNQTFWSTESKFEMNYCLHCEDEESAKKIHALLMIGVSGAKQDFFSIGNKKK